MGWSEKTSKAVSFFDEKDEKKATIERAYTKVVEELLTEKLVSLGVPEGAPASVINKVGYVVEEIGPDDAQKICAAMGVPYADHIQGYYICRINDAYLASKALMEQGIPVFPELAPKIQHEAVYFISDGWYDPVTKKVHVAVWDESEKVTTLSTGKVG